ncbi:MAG: flagellar M-ring protein FliF [Chitinispirillia bacterium]|nr:flagellar M-ring protein FliF [Chitinispirillia bacterium]MCL2268228.1 flagellar M-ring protein FliF [Chitinispirillia bacterium]
MSEFFKQIMTQVAALWQNLSLQQRLIIAALVGFTLLTLIGLLFFSGSDGGGGGGGGRGGKPSGMSVLYSDLELEEAAQITDQLTKGSYKYTLANNGRNVLVNTKQLHEIRMALAKEGLPRRRGVGYELFDKTNLGATDMVQRLNRQRAIEGELQRTIENMDEVKSARVHIVVPEHTIFLDQQRDAKASVVIRPTIGRSLTKDQVRAITHLVASSVDGLSTQNISIIDTEGKLLSSPYAGDDGAMASSQNRELQQSVEKHLVSKANQMLSGVLGHSKAIIQVTADLDFDKVEKEILTFDPESRVIRSEERQDENTKNAPDGDHQRERSVTNYDIDKTVQRVVQEIGNIKRLTVAVAVDGRYDFAEGKRTFVDRAIDELQKIEELVKNAVGYDLARGDQITVASMRFDNEDAVMAGIRWSEEEKRNQRATYIKLGLALIAGITVLLLMRSMAGAVVSAMNPPPPALEELGLENLVEEDAPPSEAELRAAAILEQVELLTSQSPANIAAIIRQWLVEGVGDSKNQS